MLATVNLFREATMTTLDNAFQATGSGNTYSDFTAVPRANTIWGFLTTASQNRFSVGGSFSGWYWGVQAMGGAPDESGRVGPAPNDYCSYAGVFGTGVYVTGVAGTSVNNVGVYGQTGEEEDRSELFPKDIVAGVVGASGKLGFGVVGWAPYATGVKGWSFTSAGVYGETNNGNGVEGVSVWQIGVRGISQTNNAGVMGVSRANGPTIPDPVTIAGVIGTSNTQHGVIGTSDANFGVFGYSKKRHGIVGVTGNPADPTAFAGIFAGNVYSNGTMSAPVKNAMVPFPDGSQRLLHCMESPEHWFEDFGSAKLARGRAEVKLDANFAKVIKRGDYRVFVTPEGDCRGLFVRRKSANRFEVRELMGGKSSVAFSYRIIGRRKDIKQHRRFAKIENPLPLPSRPPREPRQPKPTTAELRAFIARVEKEARERAPKGAEKGRPRMRTKRPRPDFARLMQQLSTRAEKK
jgi:hypothetical protein